MWLAQQLKDWKLIVGLLFLLAVIIHKFSVHYSGVAEEQTVSQHLSNTQNNQSKSGVSQGRQSGFVNTQSDQANYTVGSADNLSGSSSAPASSNNVSDIREDQKLSQSTGVTDTTVVFDTWLNRTFNSDGDDDHRTDLQPGSDTGSGSRIASDASQPIFENKDDRAVREIYSTGPSLDENDANDQAAHKAIAGRVLSSNGEVLEGLAVSAFMRGAHNGENVRVTTKSGADGRFSMPHMLAGDYTVSVEPDENHAGTSQILRAGDVSARLVLPALRYWYVHGLVSDSYGEPISGAKVHPPANSKTVITDASGTFKFRTTAENSGGLVLRYEADGYTSATRHLAGADLQKQAMDASIQLQSAGALVFSGKVVDKQGEPVSKAYVNLRSRRPSYDLSVHADKYGNFTIANVRPSRSVSIMITAGNRYQPFNVSAVQLQEDVNLPVTLNHSGASSLVMRVTDSEGAGLPAMSFFTLNSASGGSTQVSTSDGDGLLVMDSVIPGTLMLRSTANSPNVVVKGIVVRAGEQDQQEISVDVGQYSLHGRVLDSDGKPMANVDLSMSYTVEKGALESITSRTLKSDEDGSFLFTGLGSGERSIKVASREDGERSFIADPAAHSDGEPLVLR